MPAATSRFRMKATSGGGGDYDLCPAGNFPAVLVGIVDLGTHTDSFKGKSYDSGQVALIWELSSEIKPNGEPYMLIKQYGMSFGESSNLRKLVEGWGGKKFGDNDEFDLERLLGKPCLINVVHKKSSAGKDVHQVNSVSAVPKGMSVNKPFHDPFIYTIDMGLNAAPTHDWLPFLYGEQLSDIIGRCHEFRSGGSGTTTPNDDGMDDAPF